MEYVLHIHMCMKTHTSHKTCLRMVICIYITFNWSVLVSGNHWNHKQSPLDPTLHSQTSSFPPRHWLFTLSPLCSVLGRSLEIMRGQGSSGGFMWDQAELCPERRRSETYRAVQRLGDRQRRWSRGFAHWRPVAYLTPTPCQVGCTYPFRVLSHPRVNLLLIEYLNLGL